MTVKTAVLDGEVLKRKESGLTNSFTRKLKLLARFR
jgi:hypothetical protein